MIRWRSRVLPFAISTSFAAAAACSAQQSTEPSNSTEQASTGCAVTPNPSESLFVTDPTALANFSLGAVMSQIVATGSTTGQTSLELYQQLVDTLNDAAHARTKGPHCDDQKNSSGQPTINGFPEQFCPRQEGFLAGTDPFIAPVGDGGTPNPDSYVTTGLVNRFDLAPNNGANCGQYRVVYGKLSGKTNIFDRMLLIFEAVLPNPNPSEGLLGCLPVAKFWDDLSADPSPSSRASKLKSFYFNGLKGFAPVIRAQNYGIGGGTNTGQIRANMFMFQAPGDPLSGQEWELREFRLSQSCSGTGCSLTADNTFVQTNPWGQLFGGTDPQSLAFQNAFLGQVPHLAAKSVAKIGMSTPTVDDGPQSDEQVPTNQDYFVQAENNTVFLKNITAKLASIGRSDLTAHNILDRATTQGCAGCHEIANGRDLGPDGDGGAKLTWPFSNGFTQVDESSHLSNALIQVFLPARAKVLVGFINAHCATDGGSGSGDGGGPPPPADETVGGSAIGAAN